MSLNNNNIITNASTARYESDRDYIQSALELAIQKVVLRHKGGIQLEVGAINETAKDVKLTEGKITWTSQELAGLTGEIVFDEGIDNDTIFYVGEKLPVYESETTWYVNEQGRIVLQIASKVFGADEVPAKEPDDDDSSDTSELITVSTIKNSPSGYYGRTVKYETEKGTNYEWQIFHADKGGMYLITKDYIKREDIPNSWKNGVETENKPNCDNTSYERSAWFKNILNDYENGSENVKENMKNLNRSFFIYKEYTSDNENMKQVAYMLDTDAWGKYGDVKANWVIGGPSLELLCKSYNAYKGSEILVCEATSEVGYQINKNGEGMATYVDVFSASEAYEMYTISGVNNAVGYWLASLSSSSTVLSVSNGRVSIAIFVYATTCGFRPVVYLKPSTCLEELEDGTFIVV